MARMGARVLPMRDVMRFPILLSESLRDHVASGSAARDFCLRATWKKGPAFDAIGPFMVSFTQFTPHRITDFLDIWRIGDLLGDQLVGIDSAYGVVNYFQPARRRVGSLSVWTEESGLADFVGLPHHREIMRRYRPRGLPLRSARWWTEKLDFRQAIAHGQHLLNTSQERRIAM